MIASYVAQPKVTRIVRRSASPMRCLPVQAKVISPKVTPEARPAKAADLNRWAYLSDQEMLNLAKQMLAGSISADLLKKLSRRELVALLRESDGTGTGPNQGAG